MNANGHPTTLSRATSRASHRSRNSSLSRAQSLIKKNIELIDLKPADVLIERFVAWKVIVKQLTSYFEGIADIEKIVARDLTKLAGVIQVPFRAGNQFLGEGGLQDIYYNIRDKTRVIADQHADLGRTIESSIVQHLQKLRAEIKAHIKNVQNDTGKLAISVAKERELSTKLVGELANNISTFKNTPMNLHPKNDPYISNQAVARQLQRQVLEENLLQKSIVMMQQNSAHFEEGIVRSIQSAWQTYDEWQSRSAATIQEILQNLNVHMSSLAADREWIQFAARSDHLLDPDTPLRDPSAINYPLKDDPSVFPVHFGHLERKKRFTRHYTESYYVLTPSGFLHEFPSSDPALAQHPSFSLFLPTCTLGPPSSPTARGHKFHIEGRKDGTGTTNTKTGSLRGLLPLGHNSDSTKAWSFRARSRDEMMEWWNDIRMLCARYLIASEMVDRTGPVEAAVKAAGYNEEDFDEPEDEGAADEHEGDTDAQMPNQGERHWSGDEEDHHRTYADKLPPGYSRPQSLAEKSHPVEPKQTKSAIDRPFSAKFSADIHKNYQTESNPSISLGRTVEPHAKCSQHTEPNGIAMDVNEAAHGVNGVRIRNQAGVVEKKSTRQMEKSPETKAGNRQDEETTLAVVDSDAEQTESRRTPSPRSVQLPTTDQIPNHELHPASRELPSLQFHDDDQRQMDEADAGPDANSDIYASEQGSPCDAPQESSLAAQPSGRSGLIGTVAASIGNVVRSAAGRPSS